MKKRVGFWISETKDKRLGMEIFANDFKSDDLEFVKIDIDSELESQGPFDLIIHKFLDLLVNQNMGCKKSLDQITRINKYIASHENMVLLDPLDTFPVMINRCKQNFLTHQVVQHRKLRKRIFAPNYCRLDTTDVAECMLQVQKCDLQFPIVCKPEIAHGQIAHEMCIVFNKDGFRDIDVPCVAQTFINHGARLFKIFVVGRHTYFCHRPSVKNLSAGDFPTLFFNTNDVSKEESRHALTELDEEDRSIATEPGMQLELFEEIAHVYSQQSGLNLYGIDLILCNNTGRYAIIDVNSFPGYEKMPNFYPCLEDIVRERLVLSPRSEHNASS